MAFGDHIYRQTKIITGKCHECETSFIKKDKGVRTH